MNHNQFFALGITLLALLLLALPITAQDDDGDDAANLLDSCVAEREYDADADYFPDKASFEHAEGVTVTYNGHYKVVTVSNAYEDAPVYQYVLTQCGTPRPDAESFEGDEVRFVDVPVDDTITLATTQLTHLAKLGHLDDLVGLDSFLYAYNETVREMINAGELTEVGSGAEVNVEAVLDLNPDVVFVYGFNPSTNAFPVLEDAGVFTALNAESREQTPLGYAEWLKFTALFYNEEAAATEAFNEIETSYNEATELAAEVPEDERPAVLKNAFSSFSEAWNLPGTNTFSAQFILDAGGQLVLQDELEGESSVVPFDFEVVYDAGLDADFWLPTRFGVNTLDGLLSQDERYADFAAVENGNVYNNNARVNENGGNDYYESGVTNPHLILRDLIHIFHPELLPDHELYYYRKLD